MQLHPVHSPGYAYGYSVMMVMTVVMVVMTMMLKFSSADVA